ncbi:hypothetical protein ACTXT7_016838, partial [Hymenolepis weldensis]
MEFTKSVTKQLKKIAAIDMKAAQRAEFVDFVGNASEEEDCEEVVEDAVSIEGGGSLVAVGASSHSLPKTRTASSRRKSERH